nr:MAG TPA: hypothetical protein [Caudoviricetes sp.]DAU13810.1 MAG TPA: hypothetical protein [Caudoviricetes sp.]
MCKIHISLSFIIRTREVCYTSWLVFLLHCTFYLLYESLRT